MLKSVSGALREVPSSAALSTQMSRSVAGSSSGYEGVSRGLAPLMWMAGGAIGATAALWAYNKYSQKQRDESLCKGFSIVGMAFGDEGKGKLVDPVCDDSTVVVRATGGSNAGHSVEVYGKRFATHVLPSGILRENVVSVLGNGMVVNLAQLTGEYTKLRDDLATTGHVLGKLLIDEKAHLTLSTHLYLDGAQEEARGAQKIGTTKQGVGPTNVDRIGRCGVRMIELKLAMQGDTQPLTQAIERHFAAHEADFAQAGFTRQGILAETLAHAEKLTQLIPDFMESIVDTGPRLSAMVQQEGKRIVFEGSQAVLLDVNQGPLYPNVTSSGTDVTAQLQGSDLPHTMLQGAMGVLKIYTSKVGSGKLPTLMKDEYAALNDVIVSVGHEKGTTTGRRRDIGHIDCVLARKAARNLDRFAITRLDTLAEALEQEATQRQGDAAKILVCYAYRDTRTNQEYSMPPTVASEFEHMQPLYREFEAFSTQAVKEAKTFDALPAAAKTLLRFVEQQVGLPLVAVGNGASSEELIYCASAKQDKGPQAMAFRKPISITGAQFSRPAALL